MKITNIKKIGRAPVYDLSVKDVEHYVLENGVVTHNTGIMYSANQAFIITKAQEKEGTEIVGYNFTINIAKSRFVKEKAKFPFTVLYGKGVQKYSGLLDLAIEAQMITKAKQGWYAEVNQETGELIEPNMRLKELMTREDIWNRVLTNTKFNDYIKTRYSLEVQATEDLEDEVDLE